MAQLNDKKLSKLSRVELLELLVEQGEQLERAKQELAVMTNRAACQEKIARLAEGAISRLAGVLEASQLVQEQYTQSLQELKAQMGVTNESIPADMASNNAKAVDEALTASQSHGYQDLANQQSYAYNANYGSTYPYSANAGYGSYAQSQYQPTATYQDWNAAYRAMYAEQMQSQAYAQDANQQQDAYQAASAQYSDQAQNYQAPQYAQVGAVAQESYENSSSQEGSEQ